MTLKTQVATATPVGVALLLTAVFVGITLFIAFWKKRKARRIRRKARRRHRWNWGYFWAAFAFIAFSAYILFLDNNY